MSALNMPGIVLVLTAGGFLEDAANLDGYQAEHAGGYIPSIAAEALRYGEVATPRRGKLVFNPQAAARWNITFPLDLFEVSTIYDTSGLVANR